MARREALFAIYNGDFEGPFAIVLSAFTLGNEVLLFVQLQNNFELWTIQNVLGRNYTFRNRTMNGERQPLEHLMLSWLRSNPGDLCLQPEYIDVATTPIGAPTKDEFLRMFEQNGRSPTPEWLCDMMLFWMTDTYTFPLFANLEVGVITPQSFTNLREQFQQLCSCCEECKMTNMSICAKDNMYGSQHTLCAKHLFVYLESHIQLLKAACAIQPTFEPQYVLCPWCLAIVDVTTLLKNILDLSPDTPSVSLVIELAYLLSQKCH